MDINCYQVLYISDSALTPRNLYWETLHALGYQPHFYRGDAKRQFQKALAILTDNEKKTPVVIVDEAHLLSREMLAEIRFLLNLRMDSYSAMSLILVGQKELRETLKLQVNKAIWQRVDMRFHLQALTREETAGRRQLLLPVSDNYICRFPSFLFWSFLLSGLRCWAAAVQQQGKIKS